MPLGGEGEGKVQVVFCCSSGTRDREIMFLAAIKLIGGGSAESV